MLGRATHYPAWHADHKRAPEAGQNTPPLRPGRRHTSGGWKEATTVRYEARQSPEHGWYVVSEEGHLAHTPEPDGALRAAFFGTDQDAAEDLADELTTRRQLT